MKQAIKKHIINFGAIIGFIIIIIASTPIKSISAKTKGDIGKTSTQALNRSSSSQTFTFVLTHLLEKKLTKDAYFSVGNKKIWELDFRNGDKIYYTIISMNPDNPMCGITAKDNFGDTCEICITKIHGDTSKIEFKYNGKRLTYKGYFLR